MKTTLTLLCAVATAASMVSPSRATALSEKSRFDRKPMMQPIRRLGLLPVTHNLADARKNLSDQTTLRGVLAQPLTADDFAQKFNASLKAVSDASGRFWTLDAVPTEMAEGKSPSGAEVSSFQRAQLVSEYDLDGWLRTDVYFSADHTAVRLTMTGPQFMPIIAREDVLLPYGADWDAISNAFAQAIGRLSETIGHDGRVVFENDELLGIDFGTERGLTTGQRLKAGLVVQSAAHPQTGEVIRFQRHALFELEVVETKQGASLCRKLFFDPDLLRQAEMSYGSGTDRKFQLLVWRDGNGLSAEHSSGLWKSPQSTQPRAESSQSGFIPRESISFQANPPVNPPHPNNPVTAKASSAPAVAMTGQDSLFPSFRREQNSFFSTMKFSAGSSSGTLELSKGPVGSHLPSYLLNTFSLQDGFRYAGEWSIRYGAEYASFSGDLNGSRFSFKGSGLAPASSLQIPDVPLSWGIEAQYNSGTVKTEKSKKTLDAFELFGALATERVLEGGWGLGIEYKQSLTGLLAGAFGFETAIEVHPGAPALKELGVQWRYIDDGDRWTEWMLGVTWKLGAVE